MMPVRPFPQAVISGVKPYVVATFTSAPRAMSSRTQSAWPCQQAKCSAVQPGRVLPLDARVPVAQRAQAYYAALLSCLN